MRSDDAPFHRAIQALTDPARPVRLQACAVLAWAQRAEAIPALRTARASADAPTAATAARALAAVAGRDLDAFTTDRAALSLLLAPGLQGRAPWLGFADRVHARIGSRLAALGFVPEQIFQHDARYRRGDAVLVFTWDPYEVRAFGHLDGEPVERALGVAQAGPASAGEVDGWAEEIAGKMSASSLEPRASSLPPR